MGRYGKTRGQKSGRSRYALNEEKLPNRTRKNETNYFVLGVLLIAAAAGGFFVIKLGEGFLGSDSLITAWLDKSLAPEAQTKKSKPIAEINEQKTSTAKELDLIEFGEPGQGLVLPVLDSSDDAIRGDLIALTPDIAPYLKTGQILRHYMLIANDFSQGIRVARHFAFLKPSEQFSVQDKNGESIISANSYQRFDSLAKAIGAIDAAGWLAVYKKYRPLMLQVFSEFSYPDGHNLDDLFIMAAKQILSAPVIDGPIAVVKQSVSYKYADSKLEALNPVHKQMLRMGPANTRLIQKKIGELMDELVNPRAGQTPGQAY